MTRFLIIIVWLFLYLPELTSQKVNIGVGPTIAFNNAIFGLQGKVAYDITEKFSVAGTYNYYFRKNVNYAIDLDARLQLFTIQEYTIHPMGGMSLYRIGNTKTALTTGLFIRVDREWVDVYIEPKFLFDEKSYFILSGGLYF